MRKNNKYFIWYTARLVLASYLFINWAAPFAQCSLWDERRDASLRTRALESDGGGGGAPRVYIVQDVHQNVAAQKDIARIIQTLSERAYAIVGVEGAEGPLDFSWHRDFPGQASAKKAVFSYFLQQGWISGIEFAGLCSQNPRLEFWGAENKELYLDHVQAYLAAAPNAPAVSARIQRLRSALDQYKENHWNPALKKWDHRRRLYAQGSLGLKKYLRFLMRQARSQNDQTKVFLRAADIGELALALARLEKSTGDILAKSVAEKTSLKLDQDLSALEDLVSFKLKPQDAEAYPKEGSLANEIAQGFARLGLRLTDQVPPLALAAFERFNRDALKRNSALIKNFLRRANQTPFSGVRPILILVVGGFHTQAILEILKKEKISAQVLTPSLGKAPVSGTDYLKEYDPNPAPLERLFRGEQLTLAPPPSCLENPLFATAKTKMVPQLLTSKLCAINFMEAADSWKEKVEELNAYARQRKGLKEMIRGMEKSGDGKGFRFILSLGNGWSLHVSQNKPALMTFWRERNDINLNRKEDRQNVERAETQGLVGIFHLLQLYFIENKTTVLPNPNALTLAAEQFIRLLYEESLNPGSFKNIFDTAVFRDKMSSSSYTVVRWLCTGERKWKFANYDQWTRALSRNQFLQQLGSARPTTREEFDRYTKLAQQATIAIAMSLHPLFYNGNAWIEFSAQPGSWDTLHRALSMVFRAYLLVHLKYAIKLHSCWNNDYFSPPAALCLTLAEAAGGSSIKQILLQLRKSWSVNIMDSFNITPLLNAVYNGNEENVRVLLAAGAEVNQRCFNGSTALHIACETGSIKIVTLLLDAGANLNAENNYGYRPITIAVLRNDAVLTAFLISRGAQTDVLNVKLFTLLQLAAQFGCTASASVLLQHGAELEGDSLRGSPLLMAARYGHLPMVKLLITVGSSTFGRDYDGNTALHLALGSKHYNVATFLIKIGADPYSLNHAQNTPLEMRSEIAQEFWQYFMKKTKDEEILEIAQRQPLPFMRDLYIGLNSSQQRESVWLGLRVIFRTEMARKRLLKYLQKKESNFNGHELIKRYFSFRDQSWRNAELPARQFEKDYAAYLGIKNNEPGWVGRLIAGGADVHSSTIEKNKTFLHVAAEEGDWECTEILLNAGTDVEAVDAFKMTPLHWAAVNGNLRTVQKLLRYGANVNALDESNRTPLICAVRNNHEAVARLLLEKNAQIDLQDEKLWAAIHWAVRNKHYNLVALLIEHNASLDLLTLQGSPLHLAVVCGFKEIINLLLFYGADVHKLDLRNQPPLEYATEHPVTEIIFILLAAGANAMHMGRNNVLLAGAITNSVYHKLSDLSIFDYAALLLRQPPEFWREIYLRVAQIPAEVRQLLTALGLTLRVTERQHQEQLKQYIFNGGQFPQELSNLLARHRQDSKNFFVQMSKPSMNPAKLRDLNRAGALLDWTAKHRVIAGIHQERSGSGLNSLQRVSRRSSELVNRYLNGELTEKINAEIFDLPGFAMRIILEFLAPMPLTESVLRLLPGSHAVQQLSNEFWSPGALPLPSQNYVKIARHLFSAQEQPLHFIGSVPMQDSQSYANGTNIYLNSLSLVYCFLLCASPHRVSGEDPNFSRDLAAAIRQSAVKMAQGSPSSDALIDILKTLTQGRYDWDKEQWHIFNSHLVDETLFDFAFSAANAPDKVKIIELLASLAAEHYNRYWDGVHWVGSNEKDKKVYKQRMTMTLKAMEYFRMSKVGELYIKLGRFGRSNLETRTANLLEAVHQNNFREATYHLSRTYNPNGIDRLGKTPLQWAQEYKYEMMVGLLLAAGGKTAEEALSDNGVEALFLSQQ